MPTLSQSRLLTALCGALLLSVGLRANAKDVPKPDIASYSYSDGVYSETVTLGADGRYTQQETELPGSAKLQSVIHGGALHGLSDQKFKIIGTWRLLDGPDGKPLALPTYAAPLPPGAVVLLIHALPFGLTWENQPPLLFRTNRTLDAAEFTAPPPVLPSTPAVNFKVIIKPK